MELDEFKDKWQQQMQAESVQFKHSAQEMNALLTSVKSQLHKTTQQNKFWLKVIIAGIVICLGGYLNFRLQYTPERFPQINVQLYDASFLLGIVIIVLKLLLSTWWTVTFSSLNTESLDTTLKNSLERVSKEFEFIYQISFAGCFLLLPPLLFLEIRVIGPLFGWTFSTNPWLAGACAFALALGCIGIGHYLYRRSYNQDMKQVRAYLAQLEE
ncbi:MAG: hypothetical protein V4714_00350 [Bacteroidota bacterium]